MNRVIYIKMILKVKSNSLVKTILHYGVAFSAKILKFIKNLNAKNWASHSAKKHIKYK